MSNLDGNGPEGGSELADWLSRIFQDRIGWTQPRLGHPGRTQNPGRDQGRPPLPQGRQARKTIRPPGWSDRFRVAEANLVGSGNEGTVYRLDAGRCIKISRDRKALRKEIAAMRQGQPCPHFPRLYEWGPDYMIREYISGGHLSRHLDKHRLTREIAEQLISIFVWLRRLGFKRVDMRLQHIIHSDGRLLVIDPANLNKEDDPFPRKAWSSLRKRGHGGAFREYLAELAPSLYEEWKEKLT